MRDLAFFLRLFAPHRWWLAGGILLALATSVSAIGLLTLSGWFITSSALAGLLAPDGVAIAFNFLVPAAQIRALAIARTLSRYGERLVTHEATFRALAEIRVWFFKQLIPLVPGRLSLLRSGDLLTRMTADIDALDALYLRLLAPITVAVFGGGGVIALLYGYAPEVGLIAFAALTAAAVLVPWYFNRLGRSGAAQVVTLMAKLRSGQIDLLRGMTDLMVCGAYGRYQNALDELSERLIGVQRDNNRLTALSSALTLLVSQVAVLAVVSVGAMAMQQQLSGPDLALVVFCLMAAFELVAPLPQALQMLAQTQSAASRIRTVATLEPTLVEPAVDEPLPERFELTLTGVGFRYSAQSDWVLRQVDLTIPQGAKIALVGASGSGKTTLLHLLMRFYDPTEGVIALAGRNYRDFRSERLLTRFSVLSQRSQLFAGTIRENLLLAKPEAGEDELLDAVGKAGLDKLVGSSVEGLNRWIGESGRRVSGGEARRIALARLYLKNAPIVLLDEPTEGLDAATEREVLQALNNFCRDKTVVTATHRQAGLTAMDRIYRVENGMLTGL